MTKPKASREHQIRTNVARSEAAKKARRNWMRALRVRSETQREASASQPTDSVE